MVIIARVCPPAFTGPETEFCQYSLELFGLNDTKKKKQKKNCLIY
jgi:hypothetical protein